MARRTLNNAADPVLLYHKTEFAREWDAIVANRAAMHAEHARKEKEIIMRLEAERRLELYRRDVKAGLLHKFVGEPAYEVGAVIDEGSAPTILTTGENTNEIATL
jgi:hypothetical protein